MRKAKKRREGESSPRVGPGPEAANPRRFIVRWRRPHLLRFFVRAGGLVEVVGRSVAGGRAVRARQSGRKAGATTAAAAPVGG